MTYRADIDGLRTIAVLLVLVFHFDLLMIGKAGFVGVDVFFVISGFLITSIIRRELAAGTFHFGRFLYRRIRRLYPALLATLILTLAAGWFLFFPHRLSELAAEMIYSLLHVVNFYFWQNINYFNLRAGAVPLLHMWSLSVEEQFYFFFPPVCWLIWKIAPRLLLPLVALALLASFALGLIFTPQKPELSFYLLPTRAWELLVGAVLALALYERKPAGGWLQVMGPLGLVLIAASIVFYGPLTRVPGWFALLPTLGAAALILGGFAPAAPVTRALSTAPMVWIGMISYPLYLIHWPVRIFLQEHLIDFTFGWRLFGFLLSFVLAAGIYTLIETPLRRGRILPGMGAFLGVSAGMFAVLMGLSGLILQRDGLPGRFDPQVGELLAYANDGKLARKHCQGVAAAGDPGCAIGAPGAPREVLVLGDSHGRAFSEAVGLWLESAGRAGTLMFRPGCMPLRGAGAPRCIEGFDPILDFAAKAPEIREVVLISIWRQGLPKGGAAFDGRWVPEDAVAEVFADHLARTVADLRAAGKEVTIFRPFFSAQGAVPERLAGNLAFGRNWPVDRPLAEHMETFAPVHAAMEAVEGAGVRLLSIIEPFCAGGICRAVVDGTPLFIDSNHLSRRHSAAVAERLRAVAGE